MNSLTEGVFSLCLYAAVIGIVSLLLPSGDIGDTVRKGSRLLLIALGIRLIFSFASIDWKSMTDLETSDASKAEDYVSLRLAEPICDAVEEQVKEILTQFGISGGQIRIDCNKGSYGDVSLQHISVIIPHGFEEKRASLKRMLLKKFDVFCDVTVEEESDGSE